MITRLLFLLLEDPDNLPISSRFRRAARETDLSSGRWSSSLEREGLVSREHNRLRPEGSARSGKQKWCLELALIDKKSPQQAA